MKRMENEKKLTKLRKICVTYNNDLKDIYPSLCNDLRSVIVKCNNELLRYELISLGYNGIDKISINSNNYFTIGYNVHYHRNMILWSKKCEVSWLDFNSREPIAGKYYVKISFSTGAYYIIDNKNEHNEINYRKCYPLMEEMWKEILAYNPDSVDSHNYVALFEIHNQNAVKIWNNVDNILNKYRNKFTELLENDKELQIAELQAKIDELKKSK